MTKTAVLILGAHFILIVTNTVEPVCVCVCGGLIQIFFEFVYLDSVVGTQLVRKV